LVDRYCNMLMKRFLFPFLFISIITFGQESKSKSEVLKKEIALISGFGLEQLLNIRVQKDGNIGDILYTGYFSYTKAPDNKELLHGDFYFSYSDTSYVLHPPNHTDTMYLDAPIFNHIKYSGSYELGEKKGWFLEKFRLYDTKRYATPRSAASDWVVGIRFDKNTCSSSYFYGDIISGNSFRIGGNYRFEELGKCEFDEVLKLVSESEMVKIIK